MTQQRRKYNYPHEVFSAIEEIKSFHDRVEYLKTHSNYAIKSIIQANFASYIEFDLPVGAVPFVKDGTPPENSMARIERAVKVLGRLIKSNGHESTLMERASKENRFIQLIESINENDAEIIVAMKDKNLTKLFPKVTEALAKKAYPDLTL